MQHCIPVVSRIYFIISHIDPLKYMLNLFNNLHIQMIDLIYNHHITTEFMSQ